MVYILKKYKGGMEMERVKRIIRLVSLCIIMSFVLPGINSQAASEYDNAVVVNVNEDFSGNVTKGSDYQKKIYKFQLNSPGVIQIKFSTPLQGNKNETWKYNIKNASYNEVLSGSIYGNYETTYSTALGLSEGTYYLTVCSPSYYDVKSTDIFTVNIGYQISDSWESEFNDSFVSADDILVNKVYSGTTKAGSDYEKDYYKFSINSPGSINVVVNTPLQGTQNAYWDIYVYDASYNQIYEGKIYGNYSTQRTPSLGLPSGTYYIRISSPSYYEVKSRDIYRLNVTYTQSDYWEKEFNDSFQTANNININTIYSGSTRSRDDKDYFKFNLSTYGKHYFYFYNTRLENSNEMWKCTVYDSSYNEIYSAKFAGNITNNYLYTTMGAGTYYFLIEGIGYSNWNSSTWRFKVDEYKPTTEKKTTATTESTTSKNNGVKKGYVYKKNYGKYKISYVVTSNNTVAVKSVSSGKNNLKRISIPTQIEIKKKVYKVTSIGSKAFANCKNLSYVKISSNINKIGVGAFSGCKKLKTLNVYTTKLTKAKVKGSLKGSYIKTIKTYKSKKKTYSKIFKKSISKSRYNVKVK